MRSNRLQLNTAKTEILWFASDRRQHQIAVRSVRDLGIYLDSNLSMRTHVTRSVSSCFAVLRQIRSISRSVVRLVLQSLIVSLVLSRLDYGSATLVGLPACLLDRLQSVLNAAAHLVYGSRKYNHVTQLLNDLYWLRVPEQLYRVSVDVLVYHCQHGFTAPYLDNELHRVAKIESRQRLRSSATIRRWSCQMQYTPRSATVPSCSSRSSLEQSAVACDIIRDVVSVSRRSRDLFLKRLGLVSVSDMKVSFTVNIMLNC